MHVSDGELGLAMGMGQRLRANARAAQRVVDRKNAQMASARRQINSLQEQNRQLIAERTQRHRERLLEYLIENAH